MDDIRLYVDGGLIEEVSNTFDVGENIWLK